LALLLTEADVSAVLTIKEALGAVETTFRQQGESRLDDVPRRRLKLRDTVFNVMFSANADENLMGAKLYTVSANRARFLVVLFDGSTGGLKALIEADRLGQLRTGAASGVATAVLARKDARRVAIFGAGWQAQSQLEAVAAVRQLESATVVGRNPGRRDAFCEEMSSKLQLPVTAAVTPEAAVAEADIIITATTAHDPVLFGRWLSPGTHVNLIGSNHLSRREGDEDVFRRATLITVDHVPTARVESGDLAPLMESGEMGWDDVVELGAIVTGTHPGRLGDDEITVFESHGIAAEDVSIAARAYVLARSAGIGQEIPFLD